MWDFFVFLVTCLDIKTGTANSTVTALTASVVSVCLSLWLLLVFYSAAKLLFLQSMKLNLAAFKHLSF